MLSMSGGIKENAIPKSSQASILISEEHLSRAKQAAETFLSYIKTEYGATDPEIHLELTESTKTTESAITELSRAKQAAETFLSYIKTEYGATDPEIHLELTESTKTTESAITEASLLSVLTALTFIPCGVQAMSADIPDTVYSRNFSESWHYGTDRKRTDFTYFHTKLRFFF